MLISTAADIAERTEETIDVDAQVYRTREYIGNKPVPGAAGYGEDVPGEKAPQAYLVMQPPHSVTRPHFHATNQFQLFVAGGGTVGKLRVDPLTAQYAGAHTPYGPINAEAEGVHYFTLRQHWDSGARYLPASRDRLVKGRQRQVVGTLGAYGRGALPDGETGIRREMLIEPAEDGLLVEWFGLAPGARASLPDAAAGGGQYHVVVSGSLARDGGQLPPLSVEFASPDEGEVGIEAGPEGLGLLLLRFPKM